MDMDGNRIDKVMVSPLSDTAEDALDDTTG
jgi:hypothetical protein